MVQQAAVNSFVPNISTFDDSKLGTVSERFFLTHTALGHQMDSVIADVLAHDQSVDVTQMKALKEALTCSESLARLFPDDVEGNNAEMIKIASAFLNHAHAGVDNRPAEDPIREELALINAIIKAASCPDCSLMSDEPTDTTPVDTPEVDPNVPDVMDFTQHEIVENPDAT